MKNAFDSFTVDWQNQGIQTLSQPVSDKEVVATKQKQRSSFGRTTRSWKSGRDDWKGSQGYCDFEPIPAHLVGIV